mmetsp:Transcript_22361/g.37883  ORF Transcript_22361/g.37883 Transcript_22361/m.37883 type:complete len:126 (-) Transcript_22361:20-397(-)
MSSKTTPLNCPWKRTAQRSPTAAAWPFPGEITSYCKPLAVVTTFPARAMSGEIALIAAATPIEKGIWRNDLRSTSECTDTAWRGYTRRGANWKEEATVKLIMDKKILVACAISDLSKVTKSVECW